MGKLTLTKHKSRKLSRLLGSQPEPVVPDPAPKQEKEEEPKKEAAAKKPAKHEKKEGGYGK